MTAATKINSDTVIKRAFEQPQWYLTKTAYNIKVRLETIKKFVDGHTPKNILDIGCGDGSLSMHLLSTDNRITLLDRSKSMLAIASSHVPRWAAGRVKILNADFMETDLPKHSFDLILCVGVLAYIKNRRAVVDKLASLLTQDGMLIVECTDGRHFITHMIRAYKSIRAKLAGDDFPTVTQASSKLLAMLAEFGFQLCGAFRYSLPLPGLRRLFSQDFSYRAIRLIYGSADCNRRAWLGNECIYCLTLK